MATNLTQKQKTNTDKANIQDEAILNFLTNRSQNVGKSNHIVEANLISKQGEILKADGYLKKIFYYDHFEPVEDKKLKSFYTAPINSDGADELTMLTPDDEGLWMHQNAWFYLGDLSIGSTQNYQIKGQGNGLYIFVLKGQVQVADFMLSERDGLGLWDFETISFNATTDTQLLLMEVPLEL
jgi:hypothetical protein